MEITAAIRKSATRSSSPDNLMGYGIPDFSAALNSLSIHQKPGIPGSLIIAPNPFYSEITVSNLPSRAYTADAEIFDLSGRIVYASENITVSAGSQFTIRNLSALKGGIYLLKISSGSEIFMNKIIRINNQ
jgi:hypothetical protein